MGFKQPRVPEYRESDGTGKNLRNLTLFLKDFCMDSWKAAIRAQQDVTKLGEEIEEIRKEPEQPEQPEAPEEPEKEFDWYEAFLKVYPVGSIYMSVSDTDPAALFGGEWEALKDRFLLGAGDTYANESTGGSEAHTLTAEQLPKITGSIYAGGGNTGESGAGTGAFRSAEGVFAGNGIAQYKWDSSEKTMWPNGSTGYQRINMAFGGGEAHNNMPPYLAVHIWKRTA